MRCSRWTICCALVFGVKYMPVAGMVNGGRRPRSGNWGTGGVWTGGMGGEKATGGPRTGAAQVFLF